MFKPVILCVLVCYGFVRGQGPATSYGLPAAAPAPRVPLPVQRIVRPIPVVPFFAPPAPAPVQVVVSESTHTPGPVARDVEDLGAAILSHVLGKVARALGPAVDLVRAVKQIPAAIVRKLTTELSPPPPPRRHSPVASATLYALPLPLPDLGPVPTFAPAPAPAPAPAAQYGPPSL